jgi:hypothetical protein
MTDEAPKPWLSSVTSDCPVDQDAELWFKRWLYRFGRQFGTDVFYREPILPTEAFLSKVDASITPRQVKELVARLCKLMMVVPGYFGFGIFTTNAAMSFARAERGWRIVSRGVLDDRTLNGSVNRGYSRLGYLKTAEFGYALACYCWLRREETVPAWGRYVNPGPYVYLEQGLAYLKRASRTGELPAIRQPGKGRPAQGTEFTLTCSAIRRAQVAAECSVVSTSTS